MNLRPADYDKAQAVLVGELVALRQRAGITQRELAGRIGFIHNSIVRIEQGKRRVEFVELVLICAACGEPVDAFCRRFLAQVRRKK